MFKSSFVEAEMSRHDWSQFCTAKGSAEDVPSALRDLLASRSIEETDAAYWRLENNVVVQGAVYNVAEAVVMVLMASLLETLSRHVRIAVCNLLFEILNGYETVETGDLIERCKDRAREGIWQIYKLMEDEMRGSAMDLIELIEVDSSRRSAFEKIYPVADT